MSHGSYRAKRWSMGLPKLTAREAEAVFVATGKQRDIARRFGISQTQVSMIKKKIYWRWIHDDAIWARLTRVSSS